jgi:uncharacterized protein YcbK (DUF882 family)
VMESTSTVFAPMGEPAHAAAETWPIRSDVFGAQESTGATELVADTDRYTDEHPPWWSDQPTEAEPIGEVGFCEKSYTAEELDVTALAAGATATEAAFASGVVLTPRPGAEKPGEEHWDPNTTGLPLYDTGAAVRPQKLSRNFSVAELASSGGHADDRARISPVLVNCLQAIRDCTGHAVKITSGYRSWARNVVLYRNASKEPTHSRHCSGQAADITIRGMTGLQIAKLAIDAYGDAIGIGVGKSFAHIDVRGHWAVWAYSGIDAARVTAELDSHRRSRTTALQPCLCGHCGKAASPSRSTHIPAHVAEFVRTYRPYAQASEARSRVPWLVTLGQGAVESGWGKHMCGNNMFGIKARTSVPLSQRQLCKTTEIHQTPNVHYPEVISVIPRPDGRFGYVVRDWFRSFDSPIDSFDAHGKVLQAPRYAKAFTHTGDPYAFAREVAGGGYASEPSYASAVTAAMRLIEKVP